MRIIGFFGLRPRRYRHSDYLAGRVRDRISVTKILNVSHNDNKA
jgi:hypothetical protein